MKKTRKEYEKYLNELSPDYESDDWIIGGIHRHGHAMIKNMAEHYTSTIQLNLR